MVIGKTARFVPRDKALGYIYGYTIINDASARDFQFHTSQWGPGKMGDTLAPVGPYIADRSEIPTARAGSQNLGQRDADANGNTKNFIFDLGYIIQYLTNIMTLSPGDLISTGTPPASGSRASRRSRSGQATSASSRSRGWDAREPRQGRLAASPREARMAVRSFLHYALEVPDQTIGQKYYQDFGW